MPEPEVTGKIMRDGSIIIIMILVVYKFHLA